MNVSCNQQPVIIRCGKKENELKALMWVQCQVERSNIQSPVSRLRSLAASSDPSSLRLMSFKPTEPITDAREPGEADTWLPSTRSKKQK